jgi:outer membrane beta-barrel protein
MRKPAPWKVLLMAAVGIWPMLAGAADQPAQEQPKQPAPEEQVRQPVAQEQVKQPAVDERARQRAAEEQARQPAAEDQVIQPGLDRREFKVLHIPSNDFEFGLFTGAYNTEYFGTDVVGGARLGYHITEDFFAEAVYGDTRATDEVFRQILPGGVFRNPKEKLRYYELTGGINVLPGELFFWTTTARPCALYLIAGLGSTNFLDERHFTATAGFGVRAWLANWVSLQVDMRDHIFSLDVLGQQRSTQNLEFSGGVTFFF